MGKKSKNVRLCPTAEPLLYEENHSLGEWFKGRLMPIM